MTIVGDATTWSRYRVVIYDRNMFIIQTTDFLKQCSILATAIVSLNSGFNNELGTVQCKYNMNLIPDVHWQLNALRWIKTNR